MKRWFVGISVAMIVAWSVGTGTAMAQDLPLGQVRVIPTPASQPFYQYAPQAGQCQAGCAQAGTGNPILDCLNRHGLGCMATHESHGCGSCYSQVLFIFGSCRQFFGERCIKGPPPSPVPGFDPSMVKPRPDCPFCQ